MKNSKLRIKPLCVAAALSAVGLGLGLHQEYATAVPGKHNKVTIINNSGLRMIRAEIYTFNRSGVPAKIRHNFGERPVYDSSKKTRKESVTLKCNRLKSKRNNNIDYCSLKISTYEGFKPPHYISPTTCKVRNGKTYEIVIDPPNNKRFTCNEL